MRDVDARDEFPGPRPARKEQSEGSKEQKGHRGEGVSPG